MENTIGSKIKETRKKIGMTQKQLAKALNKSERMIQKYENNEVTPSFDIVKQISTILRTDIADLILSDAITKIDETLKDSDNSFHTQMAQKYSEIRKKVTTSDSFEFFDLTQYFFSSTIELLGSFKYSETFNYSIEQFDPFEIDEICEFLSNVFLLKLNEIVKRHENDKFKEKFNLKDAKPLTNKKKKEITYDNFETVAAHNDNLTNAEIEEADRRILEDINKKNTPST